MRRAVLLSSSFVALGLLSAPPAWAQPTAEQAQALEKQVRAAISAFVGPTVDVSAIPFSMKAEGDGYRVEVPTAIAFPGLTAMSSNKTGGTITGIAKPLDGGRWALSDFHYPSPMTFTFDPVGAAPPPPPPPPKGAKNAKAPPPPAVGPMTMTLTFADQAIGGVFDPSMATTSTIDGKLGGYNVTAEGPQGKTQSQIARMNFHSSWAPSTGGTLAMQGEAVAEGYTMHVPAPAAGGDVGFTMDRMTLKSHAEAVDINQLGQTIRGALGLAAAVKAAKPGEGPSAADHETMRALVVSVGQMLGSLDGEQSIEGIKVQSAMFNGSAKKFMIGFGFGAPKGVSDVHLKLAIDGLDSPMVPPGVYHDYLPRHIAIAPRVSGISKEDLQHVLTEFVDSAGQPGPDPDFMAIGMELLARGPLVLSLDEVALDVGLAALTGGGQVEVTSPSEISGEAEFRMTGLDELIKRSSTTPELKQAGPVLIMLKGLGKPDGKQMVWKIAYDGGKMMVNGNDLSGMIPGTK